jgi:CHAT domain-containing protein
LLAGAAVAAVTLPRAAQAQIPSAGPESLCTTAEQVGAATVFPTRAVLDEAAARIEQMLAELRARGDASGAPTTQLEVPLAAGSPPAPISLARYCLAAGELMRLSAQGSQLQAQNYLLAAYRLSAGADDPLAARAAYRLALVGASDPGADGTRGASTRRRGSGLVVPPQERAVLRADTSCEELTASGIAELTARQVSHLALACAAERATTTGDRSLAALSNLKLAHLEGAFAELPGQDREAFRGFARERAQAAIPLALQLGDDADGPTLVGHLAEAAVVYGDTGSAVLQSAISSLAARAHDPEAASVAAALQARLALLAKNHAVARAHAERAILAESRRPVPARLPLLYLLLAETDPPRRSQHVDAAYTTLENLRPLLPRLDPLTEESSFALYMRDVFTAAADVQLAGADAGRETGRIRRAQEIVETFRQAELQSAFGSECLPARAAADLDSLRPGETILYPLLFTDRIELLVVSNAGAGSGVTYRRLPPNRQVNRADVARLVEQVAVTLSYGDSDAWRAPARRLYDLLIAPVADRLAPDGMLAVVPDGPLRALPFAALVAPDGRYLVQQTRLSTIPALAFSQPAEGRTDEQLSVVAASLQREVDLPVGAFAALQGTEAEARIAMRYAAKGEFVPDFDRARLIKALQRPTDVLHLATHAAFNGRSDRAFIVANGEVIRLSELRDMIGRSGLRGAALDLIILSACETAVGDDEASMGLAGAAVQAGARSVIGSLWQVDDKGTAELMRQFYQRFAGGRSRSEALRKAQLALIEGGGANADPNIWAAFALLGAWR